MKVKDIDMDQKHLIQQILNFLRKITNTTCFILHVTSTNLSDQLQGTRQGGGRTLYIHTFFLSSIVFQHDFVPKYIFELLRFRFFWKEKKI